MTPTHFDIYIRQGGRWRRHEQLPGADKNAAILRAADIDENGGYDGVRAMAVVEYGSGRAPLETLAWISPHLNKTAAVKRQMADSAAKAEKAVAAQGAQSAQNAQRTQSAQGVQAAKDRDPGRTLEPPVPVESFVEPQKRPSASASRRTPEDAPPDGNQQLRAVAKIVGAGLLALGITAVLFVPISGAVRNLGADAGLSSAAIQNAIFASSLFVFVITATILMVRVYREYQTLMDQIADYEPPPGPVPVSTPRPRPRTQAPAPVPTADDRRRDGQSRQRPPRRGTEGRRSGGRRSERKHAARCAGVSGAGPFRHQG